MTKKKCGAKFPLAISVLSVLLSIGNPSPAADLTVDGNLDVTGVGDIHGNTFSLGSWIDDDAEPGVIVSYTDANNNADAGTFEIHRQSFIA